MHKILEPEVAGQLGAETVLETHVYPPHIKKLHFEFCGWLGDDIIESFPCYLVTERLKEEIEKIHLTGVILEDLKVTTSDNFKSLYPVAALPKFYWAKVIGGYTGDDFCLGTDYRFVVSEAANVLLRRFNIQHAVVEDWLEN